MYLIVPEPAILFLQVTLGLASSLGSLLAGTLLTSLRSHRLASRLLCQASLLVCASIFLSYTLLSPHISSYPPILLLASSLYGLSWGAYQTSWRILLWRCHPSRFHLAESLLQASQAVPLLLLLYLSSSVPLIASHASTASLILSFFLLLLLPCGGNGKRGAKNRENTAKTVGKREGQEEEVVMNNGCQNGKTCHPSSQLRVITSCNKVMSEVLTLTL